MKRLLLALLLSLPAFAQKFPYPQGSAVQLFDNDGSVLSGGCVYTYVAGGTVPQASYTNAGGGTPNTNPVVLDSAGHANIWLSAASYRIDIYRTNSGVCSTSNVLITSVDNIPGSGATGSSTVTANYVYAGPATGAAAVPAFRALVAADIPVTTCTNQFLRATATCATVVAADFGSAVTARTALVRASASAGAPAFGTTVDVLAYQTAEIPAFKWVTADFTTSGVGTALENISDLGVTIPASTALNVPFSCYLIYSQAVANAAVALGVQDVTISPTNIAASGLIYTSTTASTEGNFTGLTTTTATAIVSATPSATATKFIARIAGMIEAPSNASSSAIRILVSTATAADLVTVYRGSHCRWN